MASDELFKRMAYMTEAINRATELRTRDDEVAALRNSSRARFLPVWQQRHPFATGPDGTPQPIVLTATEANDEAVFLGLMGDTPWFAVGLDDTQKTPPIPKVDFRVLYDVATLLPADQGTLLAYARAMIIWHGNHRHCGRCGSPAASTEAGHSRTCTNPACKHRSFPRTDPAIITAIVHPDGEHVLLGRQPSWPKDSFSTIAGFVEPGETLEGAVIREALEETGVHVTDVRYRGSQPWPFPASIMLGFHARAVTTEIKLDGRELEDCRWFSRQDVLNGTDRGTPGDGLKMPNAFAISRYLIDSWAQGILRD
jgi:NAD+ diphosphatase